MTDILLAKPQLPEGWIDWATGEATLVRNNLFSHFPSLQDPSLLAMNTGVSMEDLTYPHPAGFKPLVDLLEDKHQAPVIIGNGAKQLLGAVFYALSKIVEQGKYSVGTKTALWLQRIHWALLPPLARAHQLEVKFANPDIEDGQIFTNHRDTGYVRMHPSAYLLLAPNNPDGCCPPYEELRKIEAWFHNPPYSCHGPIPFIHDAAYYTHSYLPEDYQLGSVGDVQIYSFSKMLGLSGLRGGYVICHDKTFYKDIIEYQEMMTVGVSILSQKFIYAVMQKMKDNPETTAAFEKANYTELTEAKQILKGVPKSILEVPDDIEKVAGMFSWTRILDKEAFHKAKLHIVSGEPFGDKSMVRLNLGVGNEVLRECVKRLKEVAT